MPGDKKTLVFGASLKPERYSNLVINRLVQNGIETVGFGLRQGEVAGVKIRTSLEGLTDLHTITLYMNPVRQKAFYKDLVRLAPGRVIFNPGTENPQLYELLREAGIEVQVACTLVLLATGQY
jgi:predicted CoA-binding protein